MLVICHVDSEEVIPTTNCDVYAGTWQQALDLVRQKIEAAMPKAGSATITIVAPPALVQAVDWSGSLTDSKTPGVFPYWQPDDRIKLQGTRAVAFPTTMVPTAHVKVEGSCFGPGGKVKAYDLKFYITVAPDGVSEEQHDLAQHLIETHWGSDSALEEAEAYATAKDLLTQRAE